MSANTPMGTYNLGDTLGQWYVNFEIGQTTWNYAQVGIGPNADGTGYNWGVAPYYEDGAGSNKRVRRDLSGVQFTATNKWYVICQAKATGGDTYTSKSGNGWGNSTAYPPTDLAQAYFQVNPLGNPSPVALVTNSTSPATSIDLSWTKWNGKNVMVVRATNSYSSAPSQGTGYSVGNPVGGGTVVYNSSGTGTTDSSLAPGTRYYYTLYSENYSYYSSGYQTSTVTVCAAPAAGSASSVATNGFTANWSAATGATAYRLDVSTNSGFSNFVSGWNDTSVSSNAASTNVTGLSAGRAHYYRLRAVNDSGTSTNSGTITVYTLCDAPVAAEATSTNASGFTAAWNAAFGATNYVLDVSTNSDFSTFVAGYSAKDVGNATSHAVTGLSAGKTYYYQVRAGNPGGVSANSATITVTTTAQSVPTLTTPTVADITDTSATLGATITSDGNSAILSRGTVWGTSTAPTGNSAPEGGTALGAFTNSRTGITAGTLIYYRGWASNAVGIAYSPEGTFYTLSPEPTTHAGSFSAAAVSDTAIALSWTAASGASGYAIFSRQGVAPTFLPVDTNAYVEGQAYGDATLAKLIAVGSTTNTTVTGLSATNTYHFSILPYAWNGADAQTCNYLTNATVPSANATTYAAEPTTSSTGVAFTNVMETQMGVQWANGNGARRIAVARTGSAVTWTPADGQGYAADTNFTAATDLGDGSKVVYDGTGNGFTLVGLTAATTYHVAVFEYNGSAGTQNYRTNLPGINSLATLGNPTGVTAARDTGAYPSGFPATRIALGWTKDNNRNVMVVRRKGAPVQWSPAQGTVYSDGDSSMGSDTVVLLGSSGLTVYTNGGPSTASLVPNTTYYYKLFTEYYGRYSSGVETNATTALPQARNTSGGAVEKPANVYLGDSTASFGCDSWASVDGNWGRWRLFMHTNATLIDGSSTAYTTYQEVEHRSATAPQFTSVGTWFWGFQVDYGATIGDQYWYVSDSTAWTDMATSGVSSLSLTVQALPDPTGLSAVRNAGSSATVIDLGWTKDGPGHDVMVVRSDDSTFFTPSPGQSYGIGYTTANDTIVYKGGGTSFQDAGLLPGHTYHYRFYSENYSYYSDGATTNETTAMPSVRNTSGGQPEQPATLRLGDTNQTFGCDGWGTISNNYGKAQLLISTNADFANGVYGIPGNYLNTEHRQVTSPQFTATGTWYWAIRLDYGSPYGSNFWYGTNSAAWVPSTATPQSGLTVTVQPLPDPLSPTAVRTPSSPSNSIDLAWTANGYQVMIVRGAGMTPGAPDNGTSYSVGNPCAGGTVVYKGFDSTSTDSGLTPGQTYTYRFFSENYNYYSPGVSVTTNTFSSAVASGTTFSMR